MPTFPRGYSNAVIHAGNAKTIARIAAETGKPLVKPKGQHTAADGITLRGIPAVGRGVQGAIHLTRPGCFIERIEDPS